MTGLADRRAWSDPLGAASLTDAAQAALLDRLGLVFAKRMLLDEHEAPQLAATA
jgi:hypothetical protein